MVLLVIVRTTTLWVFSIPFPYHSFAISPFRQKTVSKNFQSATQSTSQQETTNILQHSNTVSGIWALQSWTGFPNTGTQTEYGIYRYKSGIISVCIVLQLIGHFIKGDLLLDLS